MKKIINTMMLCIIAIGITNCNLKHSSENNQIIEAITKLKQELPIRLEGLGYVRDINYEGNTVIFCIRIREEIAVGLSVAKINNQTLAKEIFSTQIGMMSEQKKEAIKSIAEQSYGLKVLISGSESNRSGEICLSPEEIQSVLANAQNKLADDFSLEMVAMTTKLLLPTTIDQLTEWIDVQLSNETFEYVYRVDDMNYELSKIDKDMIKTMVSQNVNYLGNVINSCITTHRNLVCTYIGKTSDNKVSITLTENDLRQIINWHYAGYK